MGRGRRGGRRASKLAGPSSGSTLVKKSTSDTIEHLEALSTDVVSQLDESGRSARIAEADTPTPTSSIKLPPRKKLKREEYRASLQQEHDANGEYAEYQMPKKKWFRQRAHANPFSDHSLEYPIGPAQADWSKHFPAFINANHEAGGAENATSRQLTQKVEIADIGCGFGGLLFALAPMYPNNLMLGMEIRASVTEFVENKIRALRQQQLLPASSSLPYEEPSPSTTSTATANRVPGGYRNISVVRTNSMKFLPNFFPRASLRVIFLCFPDPHFKSRKHKARIVSATLNSEYAYVLREGGMIATITDVEELSEWIAEKFDGHGSFERVKVDEAGVGPHMHHDSEEDDDKDLMDPWTLNYVMRMTTEEGKKVDRFGGKKFVGIWRRLKDLDWPGEED